MALAISTPGSRPSRVASIRFWSVVPPPEKRMAMRSLGLMCGKHNGPKTGRHAAPVRPFASSPDRGGVAARLWADRCCGRIRRLLLQRPHHRGVAGGEVGVGGVAPDVRRALAAAGAQGVVLAAVDY